MLTRLKKSMENRQGGFTLIELLVVIIIIGILAAIAIPLFLNNRNKGYDKAAVSDITNVAKAVEAAGTDGVAYAAVTKAKIEEMTKISGDTPTLRYCATVATNTASADYVIQATSKSGSTFQYAASQGGFTDGAATNGGAGTGVGSNTKTTAAVTACPAAYPVSIAVKP